MNKGLMLLFLFGIMLQAQSQTSHIQVVSEPGISIYLDGQFKGITSTDLGGLIIQNIFSGQHTIKVVKEGYLPQEEIITVKPSEVFTYQVNKNFVPSIRITEQGNKENQAISIKKGNLKFQSLPIGINISIPSLQIYKDKTQDEWLAEQIPEGTYMVTFSWNGKELSDEFTVENEMTTYAFVNMIEGVIMNRSITPINSQQIVVKQEEVEPEKKGVGIVGALLLLIGFFAAIPLVMGAID
jgi:hypothetical protein